MDSGYDFYRNGQSDDVVFIWAGGGWLESQYGRLRYQPDDYVVIPRGTIYRFVPDDITQEDYLTGELAVMFDTQFPLELTQQALALDDPDYPLSWLG
jgi:homogentisate 1,2-dioxygenase